jgi:hypothetical protein
MLIQNVNHAVAKSREQKERADQREGEGTVLTIGRGE